MDFLPLILHELPQYPHVIKLAFQVTLCPRDAILDLHTILIELIECSLLLSLLFQVLFLVKVAVFLVV